MIAEGRDAGGPAAAGVPGRRVRVLCLAEAVTLAHVARPLSLAAQLDAGRYQVAVACDERYAAFVHAQGCEHQPLRSIPSAQFTQALLQGDPVYDHATLQAYVQADRALIQAWRPDLVVGDFRLSLSVSARLEGVPYVAISNAYWSPRYRTRLPTPVLPMTRRLPLPVAELFFRIGQPAAFAWHARAMNRLRAQHGMPGFGGDLRRVYTDADHLMLADVESLYPVPPAPGQRFVGPLTWSPRMAPPAWWADTLSQARPVVYVTLGSSGPGALLPDVVQALSSLDVQVLVSTAGAPLPAPLPANVRAEPYLPGDAATARASLLVCNGGSLTVQQAMMCGVPVLGLTTYMDQMLNMAPIEAAGAGLSLRTDRVSVQSIRQAAQALLNTASHREAAARLQQQMHQHGPVAGHFDQITRQLLGPAAP